MKKYKKNVYMCITESLFFTVEINTALQINYTSIKKEIKKKNYDRTFIKNKRARKAWSGIFKC